MKTWWSNLGGGHENYNKHSGALGKKFVTSLLRDGESVLDVGCGSGILYEQMCQYVKAFRYKGVDLTDEFVDACKEHYPEVPWEAQDMCELQEKDESWDVVVNYHCVELAGPRLEQAVKEGLRVAKKRFIVVLWKGLTMADEHKMTPMSDGIEYETQLSAPKWLSLIRSLGYEHAPWLELYTDEYRYNLYFVFDKNFKRVESGVGDDRLTQA